MAEYTQDQLDGMDESQLSAIVDQEGAVTAPESTGNGAAEATGAPAQATQTPNAESEAPKADETPKWFQDYAQNMKRELGSFRNQQSNFDKLQKKLEQTERYLAQLQNQQNLSPEDRDAQAQLQTQQQQLAQFVRQQARQEFQEAGKGYIELLDQLQEQRADMTHRQSALDLVKGVIPEKSDEAWNAVFEQSYNDIKANKPGALERQERLEKDPAFVALTMIQHQRSQVQTQAANVTQQRTATAKQAAQSPSVTGSAKGGTKPVNEMTDAELDKLSIAELEAALPESGR